MKIRTLIGAALGLGLLASAAQAQTTLRIAMTAADIPRTLGQPDQGFEGNRFTGLTMYDALTAWDLSSSDKPSVLIPGLATEWAVDANDKTKWIFKLRSGVKFHDGSAFDADAVVWNVRKVLDREAPHFDASQVGVTASRMPTLRTARKIDATTVELITSEPDSFLPINLTNLFMASPAHWAAKLAAVPATVTEAPARSAAAWTAFAADASGTGPWKMVRFVPRERLELAKNDAYWNTARVPKIDRMVLLPIPDANARTAALLSNQVDWAEAPAPDAVPQIRSRGFQLFANQQPHVWPWQFSFVEGSPWLDKRVRQAANLCVNRTDMKQLLNGLMAEAVGSVPPGHPWWGNPDFKIGYRPDEARRMMTEAGHSAQRPLKVKIQVSASGSGQMLPLPMNEYLQQALRDCFFDVELDVIEWNTLFTNWRIGAKDPTARGAHAVNITFAAMDPFFAFVRFVDSKMAPPTSNNWGFVNDPEFDRLVAAARTTFDAAARDTALAALHKRIVDETVFLWVAHDVGPRAMSPRVRGFVPPQSWFVDFSPLTMN